MKDDLEFHVPSHPNAQARTLTLLASYLMLIHKLTVKQVLQIFATPKSTGT